MRPWSMMRRTWSSTKVTPRLLRWPWRAPWAVSLRIGTRGLMQMTRSAPWRMARLMWAVFFTPPST